MVRKYIRKRKTWTIEAMRLAIESVIKHGISIRKASIDNKVPHATLSRKIHQCRCDPEKEIELIANPKGTNVQTVFTKEQEAILCQYIHTLESQFVALTGMDIRRLAFQVAEKFKIPHRFNKDIATAGEDWYRGFLKRNPEVSVKRSDPLAEKTREFNKEKIYKFFDYLESIITKYQLEPNDIYNLDETVITCVSKSDLNLDKSTESTESEPKTVEQSKLVTAEICFSASGVYTPLMLIFPSENLKSLLEGSPPGSWAAYDQTGQMTLDIFVKWLEKFIEFSKASKDSPVILLLDGYHSYLKNLQVLELADENGVNIVCLPPHCSEKLQPMQYSFMKILSFSYTTEVMKWSKSNGGKSVSIEEVYQLFGTAFMNSSTIGIPVHSFRNTGIWPPDRDTFEQEFVSCGITDFSGNESSKYMDDNDAQSTSDEIISSEKEENPETSVIDALPATVSNNIAHEPIVVITQGNNQPYIVQSSGTIDSQNAQQFIQQQYPVEKQENIQDSTMQAKTITSQDQLTVNSCQQDYEMCPVSIPPEAQLSEVKIDDLHSLIQSQKKLYFYVSPYRLNLTS